MVPQRYISRNAHLSGSEELRVNAGMMSAMDDGFGDVVSALRRNGMWEETVLLVFSDNGAMVTQGASNFPLRGNKQVLSQPSDLDRACIHPSVFFSVRMWVVRPWLVHRPSSVCLSVRLCIPPCLPSLPACHAPVRPHSWPCASLAYCDRLPDPSPLPFVRCVLRVRSKARSVRWRSSLAATRQWCGQRGARRTR